MKLNNLKVQELNAQELRTIDGGKKGTGIGGRDVLIYISDKWTELKKGFIDGWNKE